MSALVFAPKRNTHGLFDADEFLREATTFSHAHGFDEPVYVFDNTRPMPRRRAEVLGQLRTRRDLRVLAWFCHGWEDGIQAGFRCADVEALAAEVRAVSAPELTVALYCCTTGADKDPKTPERAKGPGGDGGFADRLRDALCETGVRATVYAHTVKGHTARNPFVRVFNPDERAGGMWLVDPAGPLWATWDRLLQATDLRLKFPFVPRELLEQWLRKVGRT